MSKQYINNFFEAFGEKAEGKTYAKETPLEQIIISMAEDWQDKTKAGEGMFFDFTATPDIEKPLLEYLTKGFGWTLEQPFFIRKPL